MTGLDQAQNTSFPQARERVNEGESTDLSPAAASGLSRESTGSPGLSTRPVDSALPSTEANHKAVGMHLEQTRIPADDPRHGTTRGYAAGCHEACCRRAMALYEKRGRLNRVQGTPRAVPALGSQRRLRALMALGWTSTDIAHACGWASRTAVFRILKGQGRPCTWLERKTADTISEVFERLAMQLPEPNRHRARTRTMARNRGWLPPLAWDDIDDPDERPTLREQRRKIDLDPVVVERVLDGDRLTMTRAERVEVVRQARQRGWSETRIQAVTGIAKATDNQRWGVSA